MLAVVVGAVATVLVAGASASPAAAKTRTFRDQAGDALPALDVTKVKVRNTKHAVVVRATIPDFRRRTADVVSVAVRTQAPGRPLFVAQKVRHPSGWAPVELLAGGMEAVACKGDRVRFAARSVTVRIPQRCLEGNHSSVRIGFGVGGPGSQGLGLDELENPGPDLAVDAYPSLVVDKLSPWVRYR